MKTFIQAIFSFLLLISLSLFTTQSVEAQWELLIGEEESSWNYVDMDVTLDGGLILITYVDGQYRLLRINVLGQVVMNRSFMELELPAEGIAIRQIKALKDGNYLLRYQVNNEAEYKLAKLTPYGKTIWTTDLEFNQELVEMESGDYWQVFASDLEETLEDRQVILKAFSGEDGSELWTKMYGSEQDETIMKYKQTEDGGYIIAGRQDYFNFFAMYFSPQGNLIKEFNKNFQQGSGYGLADVTITADNGIASFATYIDSSPYFPDEPNSNYLVIEKIDKDGIVEWNREHLIVMTYNPFCGYFFDNIQQNTNGNYIIEGEYGCEWQENPYLLEISSEGDLVWKKGFGFDGNYEDDDIDCFQCGCGAVIDKIKSTSDGGYLITGYDPFYEEDFFSCNHIPFAAKLNGDGGVVWLEHYDLGNTENLRFDYKESMGDTENCFLSADVNGLGGTSYIINISNNGKLYNNQINGQIYLDTNENCQNEETDNNWYQDVIVNIATPQITRYAFANQNGEFSAQLPTGNYTISYQLDNELVEMGCGESQYTANFTESYDTVSNVNFALNALVDCPKLEVEIGTPLLRRCFKNTYKISYCNKGTLAAEDAKITLEFPDEMIPLESSIEPALKEGQQWTFDLGKMDIGECGFFTVVDSISCEAELGSTICLKSRILPDDPCEAPNPLWDGSHIEVKGDCSGEYIAFALENTGNGNMEEERNLYVFENDVLVKTEKLQLASDEKRPFYWNVENKTVRLEVEQSPYSPHFNDPAQSIVEACGEGNFSIGYVNSVEQNDRNPSVDIDCQTVIGSFDPNDIQVYPKGISEQNYIEENTKLTYKIRFQNTGNDTAFRVMIVDTLPQGLEGASLNLGNSSHDYTFDIKFGNLLVWTFDNILLPDSTTNEPESHGFVQFSILPKADIELGAKIENKADIYFDFNEAVETNQVFNTIKDDLSLGLGSPLGVDLMEMDISLIEGHKVQLDWWTLAETNSSFFEVERSSDGVNFEGIERVKAQGNNEGLQHYQILDSNIEGETLLYYRLKMVDIDGSFEYSKVVSIRFEGQKVRYQLMDFNGRQTLLSWIGDVEGNYTIQAFNTLGQNTLKLKVSEIQTKLPVFDSDVYILQVFDGQGKRVKSKKVFGW